MSYSPDARARISRSIKQSEQSVVPQHRPRHRRPSPQLSGGITELVFAKHDEELPMAMLRADPDKCKITAVEVEIYKLVPRAEEPAEGEEDPELHEAGEPGQYMLEAILGSDDEPKTVVVANFSPTDAIPKDEWFAVLPTNGKVQMASIWPC